MDDRQITALFLSRDEKALSETEKHYGGLCRQIAFRILGDYSLSEECFNDVLLKVWNSIPPNNPASLRAYISKIARRTALDRLKTRNREKRGSGEICAVLSELEGTLDSGKSVEHEVEMSELSYEINQFLYSLKDDERNIFVARYWHFLSIKELSHSFGFSGAKVKSMLKRTREKLKRCLEEKQLC